jgi:hypothetical protein
MSATNLNLQELSWHEVKDDIWAANPNLAEKLDSFKKKFSFIKASYVYGDRIYKKGILHLPTKDGNTIPLNSELIPLEIKKRLDYCYLPLGLTLNKSVEVFFETEHRVMPSKIFQAGTTFGLWEFFDPEPSDFLRNIWNLSAGARSIFMLPKVGNSTAHNHLKRDYGITSYPPKNLMDEHSVFKEIVQKMLKKEHWRCDILFFSSGWLENKKNSLSHLSLRNYWLKEAWQQSFNCRNQMSYDVAWEAFTREITRRNWKPRPYIINTIKHLMSIAEGVFPGFSPIEKNNQAVPINLIQEAYVKSYRLKNYAPILMQPQHLMGPEKPVYYSLYMPTLLEYAPHAENPRSIMSDMRELKGLIEMLLTNIHTNTSYDFYHCDDDQFSEIKNSSEISKKDKRFSIYPKKYGALKFPESSPFFRGCIKISQKS